MKNTELVIQKRRILALFLCLSMMLTLFPMSAMASDTSNRLEGLDEVKDGDIYDFKNISDDCTDVCIIKPSPHMTLPSYGYSYYYDSKITYTATQFSGFSSDSDPDSRNTLISLVIPPTIESIIACNSSSLVRVTLLPGYDSVLNTISSWAFRGCTSLKYIELPETLRTIGPSAFSGCSSLSEITLPDGLESIGYEAFACCPNLKSIRIPASVTEIGDGAFGVSQLGIYPYKYNPEFIIYGYKGSAAETWARREGCRFLPIVDGTDYELFEGTGVVSVENFSTMPHREYTLGQFSDTDENAWYGANKYKAIQTAYELGIVTGKGNGIFDPNGPVQITEALKMAAVVHNIYMGGNGQFVITSDNWWKVYADYCIENGIITAEDFDGHYFHSASRAEMAYIFANTLPTSEMSVINDVKELPDVTENTPYYEEIMTMYHCGALQGNNEYGEFTPDADITRAAAAAIISRIALPKQRLTFTLKPFAPISEDGSYEEGMWVYDIETLKNLYTNRLWGLYPDMKIRMTNELATELRSDPFIYNSWVPMAADTSAVYNENADNVMVYTFKDYRLSFEIDALMKDESVSARASDTAKDYLKHIDSILASLALSGKTERERLLAIHDWMVANISYDQELSEASFLFYGPLDNGKAVCNGYAELFYYLATRSGTKCYTVSGSASSRPGATDWAYHTWNMVQLAEDNSIYYIDVTYDDPVPDTTTGRHTYFLVTAETLSADHSWEN